MKIKKRNRKTGWVTPKIIEKTMKFDEMKSEAVEPEIFYDEWESHKDGFRDYHGKLKKEKEILKEKRIGKIQRRRDIKRSDVT